MATLLRRIVDQLRLNFRRARARRFVKKKLSPHIDYPAMEALRQRFSDAARYPKYHTASGAYKYFQYEQYLTRNAERVLRLGLDRRPPQRVLDLGCGCGYFLAACKAAGHRVAGLDLSSEIFDEVVRALGLTKTIHRIEPFKPLPTLPDGPFDVVTAYEINFDQILAAPAPGSRETPDAPAALAGSWSPDHWDYFLRDLARQMTPHAELFLKFNDHPGFPALTPPIRDYFTQLGAQIDGRAAHLPQLHSRLAAMPAREAVLV